MLAKVRPLKVVVTLGMTTTEKAKQNIMAENSIVANESISAKLRFNNTILNKFLYICDVVI